MASDEMRKGESLDACFNPPPELAGDFGAYRSPLLLPDGTRIQSAEQWSARRSELLAEWHAMLGPWPPLLARPTVTWHKSATGVGHARHRVDVQIAPDRAAPGYLLVPNGHGPFPAVLVVFYQPEDSAGLNPSVRNAHDFGAQLAARGFVALCVGQQPWLEGSDVYYPSFEEASLQPLSYLAYVSANCCSALAAMPEVDAARIGVVGHSYGGKWALFSACLCERFGAVAVSDPGIMFDETRPNVNYWEPWYLGHQPGRPARDRGVPCDTNPRTGLYKQLVETGRDLHELDVLLAPRPFFVAGGSEDPPSRWQALNHTVAVNEVLGYGHRVGMAHREGHAVTPEHCDLICRFFERFLGAKRQEVPST